MSVKIMGEIWELDLPSNLKFVALALADHAQHDGSEIRPSVEYVSWKTEYTERHARRLIGQLKNMGLLVQTGRHPSGVHIYRMNLDAVKRKLPFRSVSAPDSDPDKMSGDKMSPDMGVTPPLTPESPPPDMGVRAALTWESPKPSRTIQEPSMKPSTAKNANAAFLAACRVRAFVDALLEAHKSRSAQIASIIHAHLESGVIDPNAYANKTKRQLAAAILDAGITPADVADYIAQIKQDDFWKGKGVSLHHIASNIKAWVDARDNDQQDAQPGDPSHQPFAADENAYNLDPEAAAALDDLVSAWSASSGGDT